MGSTTSVVRSKGGREAATYGTGLTAYYFTFDATQVRGALPDGFGGYLTLPKGFVPLMVVYNGAATGGTDPTFDLGTDGNLDLFMAEGDADVGIATVLAGGLTGGAGLGVALAADTVVHGGKGASVPTGGTVTGHIVGVMNDTGAPL